ncbi:hypothetical protein P3S68_011543 [Capsicum galapagoense]
MVSEGDTNPNSLYEESEIAHDSLFKPPFTLEFVIYSFFPEDIQECFNAAIIA